MKNCKKITWKRNVFFAIFILITLKRDEVHGMEKVNGFDFHPCVIAFFVLKNPQSTARHISIICKYCDDNIFGYYGLNQKCTFVT